MELSRNEIKFIKDNIATFEKIVTNNAIGIIDPGFMKRAKEIAYEHKLISCSTCNNNIITGIKNLYNKYSHQMNGNKRN